MILRAMAVAGGVAGAAGLSQFPEYSQQYTQRLGGAVDELARQIQRYEADAQKFGTTLPRMLDALATEGPVARTQAGHIAQDIARHDRLSTDLAMLEGAGPFMRARMAAYLGDREIAARALDSYRPAVPATFEGAVFAGTGFVAGWGLIAALFALVGGLWSGLGALVGRRRRV